MDKKLYVTDLDKSWLRSDLSVSDFSRHVWNTLVSKNIFITFATARSYEKSRLLLENHHLSLPAILLNGSLIVDPSGKYLVVNSISKNIVMELINHGKSLGISPFLLGIEDGKDTFLYTPSTNLGQKKFLDDRYGDPRLKMAHELYPLQHTLTLNFLGDSNTVNSLHQKVVENYLDVLEIKCAQDPYIKGIWSLEILHPLGDKVHALRFLSSYTGIAQENVIVFGDHHNDERMFEWAGKGIAVANSVEELKQKADLVLSKSNDEDGISHYLANEHKIVF